jgi:hypothetical protein
MNVRRAWGACLMLLALQGTVTVAQAWDYPYWGWYPLGGLYTADAPPYFAVHPPVYYSYVVRRPYGYSPFPYSPETLTPERPPLSPVVVHNDYACVETVSAIASTGPKRKPLRIQNPYAMSSSAAPFSPRGDSEPQPPPPPAAGVRP